MALINKIRKNSGVAIFIVSLGLLLFLVGGDLLSPGSVLFGSNDNSVGTVEGQKISRQVYEEVVDERVTNYRIQTGKAPGSEQMPAIRSEAWNNLIFKEIQIPVLNDLGLVVTKKERDDMIGGNNIHPSLRQSFTDPKTGQFDKNQLLGYIQFIQQPKPQNGIDERTFAIEKARWEILKNQVPLDRLQTKYSNLMSKSVFVTKKEAERNFIASSSQANFKYVYVPYYSIADSLIEVSDKELQAYLKDNEKQFQTEATRSIKYAVFNFEPSAEDSALVMDEMKSIIKDFKDFSNDTLFVRANSDNPELPVKYNLDQVPPLIKEDTVALDSGNVFGPYLENDKYVAYKVTDIAEDTVYSANASHILIKWESEDKKKEAYKKAKTILDSLKAGEDFAMMAAKHSQDFSNAQKGGELGWFSEGRMVPEFNDAVFSFEGTGLIEKPIETQFGYHLIKVNKEKTNKSYVISMVVRGIYASDATKDKVYAKVGQFVAGIETVEQFEEAIEGNEEITTYESGRITSDQTFLRGVGTARQVIQWAFTTEDMDKISNVMTLDNAYLVGAITGYQEEGLANLESVREEVAIKVRNSKKAEQIKEKMSGGSLEDIAAKFDGVDVRTVNAQLLNSNSISGVGMEPKGVGAVFALNNGQKTEAIEGNNGVLIAEVSSISRPESKTDYTVEKSNVQAMRVQRTSGAVFQAMKELLDIEDRRYKFY